MLQYRPRSLKQFTLVGTGNLNKIEWLVRAAMGAKAPLKVPQTILYFIQNETKHYTNMKNFNFPLVILKDFKRNPGLKSHNSTI